MKNKTKELEVDFIGGLGHLTKEEEYAISEYIKSQKLLKARKQFRLTRTIHRKKVLA